MTGGKPAEPMYVVQADDAHDYLPHDEAQNPAPYPEPEDEPTWTQEALDSTSPNGRLIPAISIAAGLGSVIGLGWLAWPSVRAGMAPLDLIQLVAALCVPPLLIAILYLLVMRNSRAEAHRFGMTAKRMRAEAIALNASVASLSRRIIANREALAEQTDLLIKMGDVASERIAEVAGTVSHQSGTIDGATRNLMTAAADAERRVATILSSLPKAHDEMRGLSERVDEAGLLASQRAAALDAQLIALSERGRESDQIAGGAAERLAAHIARMEATSESASARLETVSEQMSAEVDNVLDRAANAVDEARRGITAQGEAILAMLSANQAALDRAGKDSADALADRISAIEEAVGRIAERLGEEQARGTALFNGLAGGIQEFDQSLRAVHESASERSQMLAASISALHQSVQAMTEALNVGDSTAHRVISTSEELLTALDASAREIDETLPEALQRLDARILASRKVVAGAKPELLALVTAAESTHDAIEAIADVVSTQRDTLAKTQASLLETLETGGERAQALGEIVDETITTTRRFAGDAAPQLVDALLRVRETASAAADHAREAMSGIVPNVSRALEEASGGAIRRVLDETVRTSLAELAATTDDAVQAAARAAERLNQQMAELAETTAKVEANIQAAHAAREEADGDNFARRVSLLIEALNSNSIDLTKVFSAEVSDSAWSAYLKGDRGVFTRRAVRVLDGGDAREIHRLYDEDPIFRDNVNRYIHDFEAMLRQILALRDGSPLGVTLLSSDMGKLYVALAQAIERLRT